MNIILILIDSLNRHYLPTYGCDWVVTPHLDAFAARAWRLDGHFASSLPCMPARRDIYTGRTEFLWRPWGPLETFDLRLPRILQDYGFRTALVTDHYHYWEEAGNGYMQSFQSTEMIRGHELDFWKPPVPADAPVPRWVQNIETWRPGQGRQYFANVRDFSGEEDFFPAKVMTGAVRWLQQYAQQRPFFLQVESFDVHEPFHVPEPYASMYGDGTARDRFTLWPPYQDRRRLADFIRMATADELAFIRAQYAGKLTMVDRWFGELLAALDTLNLWDDTAVIATTDHGHDLGEHGTFAKMYPHYDTHAHIPLLLWHPAHPGHGQGITALTSTVDIFATILDLATIPVPRTVQSRSMLPLMTGMHATGREALLYGTFGQGVCCTDGEWTLFKSPERNRPLNSYSTLPSLPTPGLPSDRQAHGAISSGHYIPGIEVSLGPADMSYSMGWRM